MKTAPVIGLIIFSALAFQVSEAAPFRANRYDSLLPQRAYGGGDESAVLDLLDAESDYRKSGNNHRVLTRLLKIVRLKKVLRDKDINLRLYSDLAGVTARLKMYPLAMKCYYTASGRNLDTTLSADRADSMLHNDLMSLDTLDHQIFPENLVQSEPVGNQDIISAFDDGKIALSYAILIHVKQPLPGRRKAFKGINNVGHMFITLIKYNSDNTLVSRSFGFYPRKATPFSATPIHPKAPPVLKNDARHEWDEVVGKFISYRRFQKIMEALARCKQTPYNLNQHNCTDFGLSMAALGGVTISDTRGRWPLGSGNNPANAGQSLLEKKFSNTDPDYPETLFVSNNVSGPNQ